MTEGLVMKRVLLIFLATIFAQQGMLQEIAAQEESNMFKEGYVKELMDDSHPSAPQVEAATYNNQTETAEVKSKEPSEPIWLNSEEQPKVQPQKIKRLSEEKPGVQVRSIGAILGTSSSSNVDRDVRTLVATANQLNVSIGHVFFMVTGFQFMTAFSRDKIEPLKLRGGDPHIRISLPREYRDVKNSPAWIISTVKGDVLLEGALNPLDFFNSHGEFVEPGPVPAATDAPVVQ